MSEVKFEPFQRVLVRDGENAEWVITLFCYAHHYEDGVEYVCLNGTGWPFCLPYNNETKHLIGTTNSPTPPEPEFKWGDHVEVRDFLDNDWQPAIYCTHGPNVFLCVTKGSAFVHDWRYCRHADW